MNFDSRITQILFRPMSPESKAAETIMRDALHSILISTPPLDAMQSAGANLLLDAMQYVRGGRPTGLFSRYFF